MVETSGRVTGKAIMLTADAQETLNYWKQLTHVLKYFRAEEDPKARLPKTFIQSFIEVRAASFPAPVAPLLTEFYNRAGTRDVRC